MKVQKLFEEKKDDHLPIKYMCSYCKKVKNEKGEYVVQEPPDLKKYRISHGICPKCQKKIWSWKNESK